MKNMMEVLKLLVLESSECVHVELERKFGRPAGAPGPLLHEVLPSGPCNTRCWRCDPTCSDTVVKVRKSKVVSVLSARAFHGGSVSASDVAKVLYTHRATVFVCASESKHCHKLVLQLVAAEILQFSVVAPLGKGQPSVKVNWGTVGDGLGHEVSERWNGISHVP